VIVEPFFIHGHDRKTDFSGGEVQISAEKSLGERLIPVSAEGRRLLGCNKGKGIFVAN
jgi:hypothetical protein